MWEFLSSIGRAVRAFIEEAVEQGVSFEEFYEAVRKIYPDYSMYNALSDYLHYEEYYKRWQEMDSISDDYAFSRDYFAKRLYPPAKRFNIVARVWGYNKKTGEWEERYVTVGSDYLITKREWKEKIEEIFRNAEKEGVSDPFEVKIIEFKQAYGWWV